MNLFRWLILPMMVTALTGAAAPKTIVFFGDSLTAGYGIDDPAKSFPGLIQQRIEKAGLPYRVVNAGLSGDTTAGGLRRIDWVIRQPIDVFVLELGGNDGLRGVPPEHTRDNLQKIIDRVREKNPQVTIVLAGMQMPANMGAVFTTAFRNTFRDLAEKNQIALIPFILEGVGGQPHLNLPDGVHPTEEGHAIVAETVWKTLGPLLSAKSS